MLSVLSYRIYCVLPICKIMYVHMSYLKIAYNALRPLHTWKYFPHFVSQFIFGMIRSTFFLRKLQIKQILLCFLANVSRPDCQQHSLFVSFSCSSLSEVHGSINKSCLNIQITFLQDPVHLHPHLHLVLPNFLDF